MSPVTYCIDMECDKAWWRQAVVPNVSCEAYEMYRKPSASRSSRWTSNSDTVVLTILRSLTSRKNVWWSVSCRRRLADKTEPTTCATWWTKQNRLQAPPGGQNRINYRRRLADKTETTVGTTWWTKHNQMQVLHGGQNRTKYRRHLADKTEPTACTVWQTKRKQKQ